MEKSEKLVEKFLQNPIRLKYSQIEKVLLHFGLGHSQGKRSHQKFFDPFSQKFLIIPVHNNECKYFYKREALRIVKQLLP